MIITLLSCKQSKVKNNIEEINAIVSDFQSSEYYDFAPYFKANLVRIVIDSTKIITVKCKGANLVIEPMYGKINTKEIVFTKKTFEFCKQHSIYGITKYDKFSIIETNLWDSTYTQLIQANSNYHDSDIGFYHVKDPGKAHYKYSIVILKKECKLNEINILKDIHLIKLHDNIYLYRSFMNWDIENFNLFKCG